MVEAYEDRMEECQKYFRERRVFEKVFAGFKSKYESLGHMGGTVLLRNLSKEEKEQLSGFIGKDFSEKKQISVSCQSFEKALQRSRFSSFSLQTILESYFQMPLMAKKEEKEQKEREKERYLRELLLLAENRTEKNWLQTCIGTKNAELRYLEKGWKQDPERLYDTMKLVCHAGNSLPFSYGGYEPLPVFAARTAKNPHAFDYGTMAHYLLLSYLRFLFPEAETEEMSQTEKNWELLYQGGILKDDLSNSVLLYGLHGILPDGRLHAGLEGFLEQKEPVYLTLLSLAKIDRITSGHQKIYMVENPAVFSYLLKRYPEESFICGNGQQRMAVWVLLSKIRDQEQIFYAGDFDPEGLGIAQRLKQRFQKKVILWKYDATLYQTYLSAHRISEQRMKKLKHIILPELQEICRSMEKTGYAAYQEAMLVEYEVE